MPTGQ